MSLQEYTISTLQIAAATLLLASSCPVTVANNVQAELDIGDNSELLQVIFKQIEKLGSRDQAELTTLSKSHSEIASALLQVAPVITIKGNITDSARRLTITFTVQASQDPDPQAIQRTRPDSTREDEGWDVDWRGSGGVFHPIVGVVEPYVLGLAELVFNGILSSVIGNFLAGTSLLGDVRIV